ncbi:unnamed protein product [Schistosoma haematobium]|nr:unnamed protein product [Schistosoma haematobium]
MQRMRKAELVDTQIGDFNLGNLCQQIGDFTLTENYQLQNIVAHRRRTFFIIMIKLALHLLISLYILSEVSCEEDNNSLQPWDSSEYNPRNRVIAPYKRRQIFRFGKRNSHPTIYKEMDELPSLWDIYRK